MVDRADADLAWISDYIAKTQWKQAKDQRAPHSYTVREWVEDDSDFVRFVELTRSFGVPEQFFGTTRAYLYIDGEKFWTMGSPIDETIIINRGDGQGFYGRQTAPKVNPDLSESVYDRLAPNYDSRYDTPVCRAEDQEVFGFLSRHNAGSVLDIGAGTGLALEHLTVAKDDYLGLDPSQGMMNEFLRKNQGYSFRHTTFDDFHLPTVFDLVISLYGSPSYIDPSNYARLRDQGSKYFLMFYKEGYWPDYDDPSTLKTDYISIDMEFDRSYEWQNFVIATNLEGDLT